MNSGHYTAFARNPVDGIWRHFDDTNVSVVEEDKLVTSGSYILFYERRDLSPAESRNSAESGYAEHWFYGLTTGNRWRPESRPVSRPVSRPTTPVDWSGSTSGGDQYRSPSRATIENGELARLDEKRWAQAESTTGSNSAYAEGRRTPISGEPVDPRSSSLGQSAGGHQTTNGGSSILRPEPSVDPFASAATTTSKDSTSTRQQYSNRPPGTTRSPGYAGRDGTAVGRGGDPPRLGFPPSPEKLWSGSSTQYANSSWSTTADTTKNSSSSGNSNRRRSNTKSAIETDL